MRAAILLVLAACSVPDKHFVPGNGIDASGIDSPPTVDSSSTDVPITDPRFACNGMTLPTTAPAQIAVNGTVSDLSTGNHIAQANVALIDDVTGGALFSQGTDNQGSFSGVVVTGGSAVKAHLEITPPTSQGYMPTHIIWSRPLDKDQALNIIQAATASEMTAFAQLANAQQDNNHAVYTIGVIDCLDQPVAQATVAPSSGMVRYLVNGQPSTTDTMTDGSGSAIVFQVNPDPNGTINARYNALQFRTQSPRPTAGVWSQVLIQP